MKNKPYLSAILGLWVAASPIFADTDQRTYSFSQLSGFWKSQILDPANPEISPQRSWFAPLSAAPGTTVLAYKGQDVAQINRREISLHLFLTQSEAYQKPSPTQFDASAMDAYKKRLNSELETLRSFQQAARIELFAVQMVRYTETSDSALRCRYIQGAHALQSAIAANNSSVPAEYTNMVALYREVTATYASQLTQALSCAASVNSNMATTQQKIRTQVAELVKSDLTDDCDPTAGGTGANGCAGVKSAIDYINERNEPFANLLSSIRSIGSFTEEILGLENRMQNTQSNFQFVQENLASLESQVQALNTLDMSGIGKIPSGAGSGSGVPGIEPLPTTKAALDKALGLSSELLKGLKSYGRGLPLIMNAAACSNLPEQLPVSAGAGQDIKFSNSLAQCVEGLKAMLANSQAPGTDSPTITAFGDKVQTLSSAIMRNL